MTREIRNTAWWAGGYPLLLAVMVGVIWMDRSWYRMLQNVVPESTLDGAALQVADTLLWLAAMVLLAGAVAAWLWDGKARLLCIASIAVFSLEFLLPALAAVIPGGAFHLEDAGPVLRIGIHLAALALAVAAMRRALS